MLSGLFGFVAPWAGANAKGPVLAAVVDPGDTASVFAWDRTLEGTVAALCGAPAVGLLAERVFGYALGDAEAHRARALGHALAWVCTVPFLACWLLWGLLHWTLPRDAGRREARTAAVPAGEPGAIGRPAGDRA